MVTFLLIHGSFFGGESWDAVAGQLRRENYRVCTPTLTQHTDSAPDLSCHIQDVVAALDRIGDGEIILVGHSYGGMPVCGAADARMQKISALVLLDAFAPNNGESVLSIRASATPPAPLPALTPDKTALAVPDMAVLGLGTNNNALSLRPHSLATWTESISLAGGLTRIRQKYFARMTRYKAPYFDQTCDRLKSQADWQVTRHDENHCPMLTAPEWTSAFLGKIAQQISAEQQTTGKK